MKVYLVGGAVRDQLMGITPKDKDWVVVGTTAEVMISLGYIQVGKDFPTFLHPFTKEEYSLARRERQGGVATFDPSVTLEEDLAKRDLTINAIAYDPETREYIDPHNGRADIQNKVLRMVSEESFREDPIRTFRLCRFYARYLDFKIDTDTFWLSRRLFLENRLVGANPERIWKEFSRGLMEVKPGRMFTMMTAFGLMAGFFPELDRLWHVPQAEQHHPEIWTGAHIELSLNYAAEMGYDLETRFAVLMHDVGKGVTPEDQWPSHHGHEEAGVPLIKAICERMRIPKDCEEIAVMTSREHLNIHRAMDIRVATLVKMFERCDIYRRPERFLKVIDAAMCDARGRASRTVSFKDRPYPQAEYCRTAMSAARGVAVGVVAVKYQQKARTNVRELKDAIHAVRVSAVKKLLRELKGEV